MAHDSFKKATDIKPTKFRVVSDTAIKEWLEKNGTVAGVHVLDFGQGDCNAVIDASDRAIVYFDIGGGKNTGSRTHPWHTQWNGNACHGNCPEFSLAPTIILSHWDGDHYSTARYVVKPGNKELPATPPPVMNVRWLAPRQNRHPSKLEMPVQLGDQLRCWPANVASHRFMLTPATALVIEKCNFNGSGTYDPNLDGLVARLQRVDPDDPDEVAEQMLLPGDAPLSIIASLKKDKANIVAMLAFHHGSESHFEQETIDAIPKAAGATPKIAYTFGIKPDGKRCYDHPRKKAIEEYVKKGWVTQLTPSGKFATWPPDEADLGDHSTRGSQKLTFTEADTKASKVFMREEKKLGS